MEIFQDRQEAGEFLAEKLVSYRGRDAIVIGLPRGGVVVAAQVAKALGLPLDIIVARKIGAPSNPELAVGAITEEGAAFYGVAPEFIQQEIEQAKKEAKRRVALYRGDRPTLSLKEKIVILVDDGIATGFTMKAAVASVKMKKAKKVVVAVPVGPKETIKQLQKEVDEVIVVLVPPNFHAVGEFYLNFDQVSDEKVRSLYSGS